MEQRLELVKKEIRSLLESRKGGCTVSELQRDYKSFSGRECPFREFGHRSFREFVDAIPDVVRASYYQGREVLAAVSTKETAHVVKLIAKQKSAVKKKGSARPPLRRPRPLLGSFPFLSSSRPFGHSLRQPQRRTTTYTYPPAQHRTPLLDRTPPNPRSSNVPTWCQGRISEIVDSFSNGCSVHEMQSVYLSKYSEPINFGQLGFRTVFDMLESMYRYVTLKFVPGRGTCLFPVARNAARNANLSADASTKKPVAKATSFSTANGENEDRSEEWSEPEEFKQSDSEEIVRTNLWKILENKTSGMWAASLAAGYREMYGHDIPFKSLGYESAAQFLKTENNLWAAEQPVPNSDCIVFPLPLEDDEEFEESALYIHDLDLCDLDKKVVYVFVSHADDPNSFFVQLLENRQAIVELGSQLQNRCSTESPSNSLASRQLQPGMACCAMFTEDSMWYRARIVGVTQMDVVEVFFVDFGNCEQVPTASLRKIEPSLCEVSAQAVHCRLARTEPIGQRWSVDAVKRFKELTVGKVFAGMDCIWKDGVLTLTLCDTHDNEKDIYVHHVLVSENFAKHHEITEITSDLKSEQSSKDGHVSALVNGVQNLAVASPQHRFVKRVQLTDDHVLHVINHFGTAYVMGAEVVSWLWPHEPHLVLSSKLEEKRLVVKREVLSRRGHKQLFTELESDFKNLGSYLTVFVLTGIPEIIAIYGNPYSLLYRELQKEIEAFDSDPYWSGGEEKIEQPNYDDLSDHELCQVHAELDFIRNKLLKNMLDLEQSTDTVDRLVSIERQIAEVKQAGEKRLQERRLRYDAGHEVIPSATAFYVSNRLTAPVPGSLIPGPGHLVNPGFGRGHLSNNPSMLGAEGVMSRPVSMGRGMTHNHVMTSDLGGGSVYSQVHESSVQMPANLWQNQHPVSVSQYAGLYQSPEMDSPFTDPEIRNVGLNAYRAAVPSTYHISSNRTSSWGNNI